MPLTPSRGLSLALVAAVASLGLAPLQAAAQSRSKGRPKAAAAKVAKPPTPTYPPRLAAFPCQASAIASPVDAPAPEKKSALKGAGRVLRKATAQVASAVTDRFSVSGDEGVFLCAPKIRTRLAERASREAAKSAQPETPAVPGAVAGQKTLGLAAFADVKGDLRPALFHMDSTQKSLQSMVERIASAWPYPNAPRPKVLVNAGLRFNAEATPDDTIIVWLGVFAPPENGIENGMLDTDLYWLLAHEYAHIALGHTDKADAIYGQVQLLSNLTSAYMSGAQLSSTLRYGEARSQDPKLGERIKAAKQTHESLRFMTKSVIEPAWGLSNEDEADTVGTDLTTALGYYPRFTYVSERFSISEKRWDDRMNDAQALIGQRVGDTVADPAFQATLASGETGQAFGAVGESIKKGIYSTGRQWLIGYISRDHRSAKSRQEGLDRYKVAAYDAAGLQLEARPLKDETKALLTSAEVNNALIAARAVEATQDALLAADVVTARTEIAKAMATPFQREAYVRFWAARTALASGDQAGATRHLEATRVAPSVSPEAYRELAALYTRGGQAAKARPIIAEGRLKTGDPDYFLPEDVRIAARSMDKAALQPLMNQCRAIKRDRIAYDCTEAMADVDWSKLGPEQRKVALEFAIWGDVALIAPSSNKAGKATTAKKKSGGE